MAVMRLRLLVIAALLSGLLVASDLPVTAAASNDAPAEQVDGLFSCTAGESAPGAAVAVVKSGRVVFEKGYGFANLEDLVPNTPETRFRLASVTKSFTALAVLQLFEAGKIDLDAPIDRYLSGAPNGERITVRHLLTHTSGLGGSEDDPLEFPPGERVGYSNAGYKLLGKIVEVVSGESWEEYLRSHMFTPVGMESTGCDHAQRVLPHRARGYIYDGKGGYLNGPPEDIATTAWAAGALYSTVEDLCLWERALDSCSVIGPATLSQASAPFILNDGSTAGTGFGWLVGSYRGLREVSHGGDASGFNAWVGRYPDQHLTVIMLSNVCMRPPGPLPSAMSLGRRIAEIYLGDVMQPEGEPVEAAMTPEMMEQYVGRYRLEGRQEIIEVGGGILTIEVEGRRLIAHDNVNRLELVAAAGDTFHPREDTTTTFVFTRGEDGLVTGLTACLMGVIEIRGTRVPD